MKSKTIELLLRLVAWIPLRVQRLLARGIGRLLYWQKGRNERITRANLSACMPELDSTALDQLVLASLQSTVAMALETTSVWFRGDSWRQSKIRGFEHRELFEQALRSERGLILLLPHFGNWELAGMWASAFSPTTAIYRKPRLEAMDSMLQRVRDIGTTNMVPASSRGVMAVVKALGRGEMTVILPDQEPAREGGIFSNFYGQSALTMTLIHRLSNKTQPLILMGYARRVPGGHIVGFMQPDEAIYAEDQQQAVDGLNRSIETMVATAPEQYQWEYKRFRKRPDGVPPLY